jgi:hypothetical protein
MSDFVMPTTALQTQQMTASLNLRSRSRTRSELPLSAHLYPGQYRPSTSQHHQITQPFKAPKIAPTNDKSIAISASAKANNLALKKKKRVCPNP